MGLKLRVENHQPVPLRPLREVMREGDVFFIGKLVHKHSCGVIDVRDENSWHVWSDHGDGSHVIEVYPRQSEWNLLEYYYDFDQSTGR
jgi:hypothetical protein